MPALHKTDQKFTIGQTVSEDPEEEKKQKQFKGILNKLTIDNFEKLSVRILEVGIVERKTLEGLISQVFDKALTETSFCEMYAQLCQRLAGARDGNDRALLPTFDNPEQPSKRIDFRRLLLNQCQSEFEKGIDADKAVKADEALHPGRKDSENDDDDDHDDANDGNSNDKKDGAADGANGDGDEKKAGAADGKAAGEVDSKEGDAGTASTPLESTPSEPPAKPKDAAAEAKAAVLAARRAERVAADAARQARRRMLGNMQFIGQLYKYGLLTEKIMHNCVIQLLADEATPRAEDVECLCRLLSTVGGKLDATTKPELRDRMRVSSFLAPRRCMRLGACWGQQPGAGLEVCCEVLG
eukprot:344112-Chlamydomonas_euryale.AAC.3